MSFRAGLQQLWRFHRQNNGFVILQRYADQHLTPRGKAVFLLFLFSLSLGLVGTDVLVYVFLCSLGGLWISALGLGAIWRPRQLQVQWQLPERVLAGQPFDFTVQVSNAGPGIFACFLELDWQQGTRSVRLCSERQFYLGPGQLQRFEVSLPAAARGQAQLLRANLVSLFPLRLIFWRQPLPCQAHYWVYPVASAVMLSTRRQRAGVMQQPEFQGLRPWGTGDSPRYLHWPALARTGQLVVRHYQQRVSEVSLWLDLALPAAAADFEAAVALVRRLLEDQLQQAGVMPALTLGDQQIGGLQAYAHALQALCSVQAQPLTPAQRAAQLEAQLRRVPAQLLIVSTQAEQLLTQLRASRAPLQSPYLIYAVQETPPDDSDSLEWLPTAAVLP
ncbi:MAG: DUF58 domain-containing protein [Candidatus Sericytochromatia bacterium]|nr:DUF58 domain-containing protein [Candidatus Sericytochromatia bacterium]